jgi:hypothetical protein
LQQPHSSGSSARGPFPHGLLNYDSDRSKAEIFKQLEHAMVPIMNEG